MLVTTSPDNLKTIVPASDPVVPFINDASVVPYTIPDKVDRVMDVLFFVITKDDLVAEEREPPAAAAQAAGAAQAAAAAAPAAGVYPGAVHGALYLGVGPVRKFGMLGTDYHIR